jgi:hypothetical protein
MTLSESRSARSPEARSPAYSPQLSRLSDFESYKTTPPPVSPFFLPPQRSLHKLLALLLTVPVMLLLSALIIFAPATAFVQLDQQKLDSLHQTQQAMLSRAQSYRTHTDESSQAECIVEAHHLMDTKPQGQLYVQAQDVLKSCQDALATLKITKAQSIADGHQEAAIALVSQVEGSMQQQAVDLSRIWTGQIFNLAKAAYERGDLPEAQQMLNSITSDNPLYGVVQADLQDWKQEWSTNEASLEAAKLALGAGQLELAQAKLDLITNRSYWQAKLQPVQQELSDRQAECNRIYMEAQQNLNQQNYSAAEQSANALPDAAPWKIHKQRILQQVKSAQRNNHMKSIGISWLLGVLSYGLLSIRSKKHYSHTK